MLEKKKINPFNFFNVTLLRFLIFFPNKPLRIGFQNARNIPQGLWQAHDQISPIILLKEFIKLNVNTDTMIKNVKLAELDISISTVFLNTQTSKMI